MHDLLQPAVLSLELLQELRFVGLHPAVLKPPSIPTRFADLEMLQDRSEVLALVEQLLALV